VESRSVTLKEAIGTWQFWTVCAMTCCLGFCLFSIMVHIAPHATDMGISTANAANTLAIIGVLSIVGKVGAGYVIDRTASRVAWITGFITMAIAMFLLLAAGDMWMLFTFAAIFGLAYGSLVAGEAPLVAELFGLGSHGVIFGFVSLSFTIGAAAGPLQAGYIFDSTSSYQTAFLTCGLIAILGLALTVILKPLSNK